MGISKTKVNSLGIKFGLFFFFFFFFFFQNSLIGHVVQLEKQKCFKFCVSKSKLLPNKTVVQFQNDHVIAQLITISPLACSSY